MIDPQHLDRIVALAGAIAIEAPRRKNRFSRSAYVSWELIHDLRDALTAAGFDLEAVRRKADELTAERRKLEQGKKP